MQAGHQPLVDGRELQAVGRVGPGKVAQLVGQDGADLIALQQRKVGQRQVHGLARELLAAGHQAHGMGGDVKAIGQPHHQVGGGCGTGALGQGVHIGPQRGGLLARHGHAHHFAGLVVQLLQRLVQRAQQRHAAPQHRARQDQDERLELHLALACMAQHHHLVRHAQAHHQQRPHRGQQQAHVHREVGGQQVAPTGKLHHQRIARLQGTAACGIDAPQPRQRHQGRQHPHHHGHDAGRAHHRRHLVMGFAVALGTFGDLLQLERCRETAVLFPVDGE